MTISEVLRWCVYRVAGRYRRLAMRVMRRDVLLLGSERKFRALLETAPDAIVIVNSHGHVSLINAEAEKLFGYPREELVGQRIELLVPERLRRAHRHHFKRFVKDARTRPMGGGLELYGRRRDGSEFPVEISLGPLETNEGLLVSTVIRDTTERKRAEALLRNLADHDPMTGLRNRRSFEARLSEEVARMQRYGGDGAMLLIDIDSLKNVNDTLGHAAGDELIRSVGALIASRMRTTDVIARVGGDEFAVLMPHASEDAATEVADDLLATIRSHGLVLGAQRLRLSASIGVTSLGGGALAAEDVLVVADLALYDAKDAGRDRATLHAPRKVDLDERRARATWSQRIQAALDGDRLVAWRQPIVTLPDREVAQYELLVRMIDESGRATLPGAFLPTAERTGAIREIDRLMVSRAVELVLEAQAAGEPTAYEVNLSARSLTDPRFAHDVTQLIARSAIDPSRLVFEITETAAIANIALARTFADAMREIGCRFALDDFGAGFASFYYLKHMPLDWLKIDGDFIRNITTNPTDRLVVSHMVQIAQGLGLRTIAECVEDEETLELLSGYGIDCVQGYLIGAPEPIAPVGVAPVA